jgi:hypothetical protein
METKTANGKLQITLAKFRKAVKFANTASTEGLSDAARLERAVYIDYLTALLHQERSNLDLAIHFYARSLIGLQVYNAGREKRGEKTAVALSEAVETGLRYVLYTSHTVSERSLNLHAFAVEQVTTAGTEDAKSDQAWRDLILSVDSNALKTSEHQTADQGADETSETLVSQISWAGRNADLKQSSLAASISSALTGRAAASRSHGASDAYDGVIAAWTTTLTTLEQLLDAEEDQEAAQDLELIKAYARFESVQDYLSRDKVLLKTVPPKDGVLLLDQTLSRLAEAMKLPGLSDEQAQLLSFQQQGAKAERCVLLSDVHGISLAGIALLNKAMTYLSSTDQDASSSKAVSGEQQAQAQRLADLQGRLHRQVAEHTLALSGDANETGIVLDPSSWYTGTAKQLAHSDARTLVARSVGAKPIVLDVAWNYLSGAWAEEPAPSKQEPVQGAHQAMDVDEPVAKQAQQTPTTSAKKGLFGSIFGR